MVSMTFDEYQDYKGKLTEEQFNESIDKCIDNLDVISYRRLNQATLSLYQELTIDKVLAEYIDWTHNNQDFINRTIDKYSINGVSIDYNESSTVRNIEGIYIPSVLHRKLLSTGLYKLGW